MAADIIRRAADGPDAVYDIGTTVVNRSENDAAATVVASVTTRDGSRFEQDMGYLSKPASLYRAGEVRGIAPAHTSDCSPGQFGSVTNQTPTAGCRPSLR